MLEWLQIWVEANVTLSLIDQVRLELLNHLSVRLKVGMVLNRLFDNLFLLLNDLIVFLMIAIF
jgi:hypothetical protein